MFGIIKNSYLLFCKKLPLWIVLVLPLAAFSYADEYFQAQSFSYWMKLSGVLILTLTELALYKFAINIKFGNIWQIVKKTILISVYQVIIGFIMLIPVFIAVQIAHHHQMMSDWYLLLTFIVNIFLGGWFFAKANALLPLMIEGEKLSWAKSKEYLKGSYLGWCLVSGLIYFFYVASLYLIECDLTSIGLSSLFLIVFTLFNALYYQSKK